MRLSPFVCTWEFENTLILYHRLNMHVAYLPLSISLKDVDALPSSVREELIQKEMAVPEDFDSTAYFLMKKEEYLSMLEQEGKTAISTMFLLLSNECNFACKYCFIRKENPKVISTDTWKKALDIFLEPSSPKKWVRFYGGEPLLHFEKIVRIVEYVEKKGVTCGFAVPMNGSLLSEEMAAYFKEKKFSVMVSLDGYEEVNDIMRVYPCGRGTFEDTIRGIKILQTYGIPFSLACTIDTHNASLLGKVAHFLYTTFRPRAVEFNYPIFPVHSDSVLESTTLFEAVVSAYRSLKKVKTVPAEFYEERIRPFATKKPFLQYCGGCGAHVVLSPEGLLGPCFAFSSDNLQFWTPLGAVTSLSELRSLPLWREWRARTVFNIPECSQCAALLLCGGGCLYNAYRVHGTIWHPDAHYCRLSTQFLEFLVRSSNPCLKR